MIPAIKGISNLSFGMSELTSARDAYNQKLDEVREIQKKVEPQKEDEKILDIKA